MTVSKVELGEALERCRQRVEFWQLKARVAEVRVSELEDAVKDHQRTVAQASRVDYEAYTATVAAADKVLWKQVGR